MDIYLRLNSRSHRTGVITFASRTRQRTDRKLQKSFPPHRPDLLIPGNQGRTADRRGRHLGLHGALERPEKQRDGSS